MLPLAAVSLLLLAPGIQEDDPAPLPQTQRWRITSFLEDAGLADRVIFDFDFEPDGTIWVAASDGLYRSHGYVWHRFTEADGLPSNYVRSVLFSSRGELWVGTDAGAVTFDGQSFLPVGAEGRLAGPSVRRIVEGPPGTLWFCCDRWPYPDVSAGLTRLRDRVWTSYSVEDGLPTDYVSDVYVDAEERVYVMTREGLAEMVGERFEQPLVAAGLSEVDDYVWSMAELPSGGLLATVNGRLFVRKDEEWSVSPEPPPSSHGRMITTRDGELLSFLPGNPSLFLRWADDRFVPACEPFPYAGRDVQEIGEAPDGSIWAAGMSLLVRWERQGGQWSVFADLPPPLLADSLGGLWFGDQDRVLRLRDEQWNRLSGAKAPVFEDAEGVWMHADGGLFHWTPRSLTLVDGFEVGLDDPRILTVTPQSGLWVRGTNESGALAFAHFDGAAWSVLDLPADVSEPALGAMDCAEDGSLFVVVSDADGRSRLFLLRASIVSELELPPAYSDLNPPRVAELSSNRLAVYGFFGMYECDPLEGEWKPVAGLPARHVGAVTRWQDELWICTSGSSGGRGGLLRVSDGIRTQFHVFARIIDGRDGNGAPLFASNDGVYRLTSGQAPTLLELPVPVRVDQALEDHAGAFWIGTGEEVYRFQPDGDEPDTVVGTPKEITVGDDLVVRYQGFERFRPLSEGAIYPLEARIDGSEWFRVSHQGSGELIIRDLALGSHLIELSAVDGGGDVDSMPAEVRIDVRQVPLQSRAWFLPALIVVFVLILALAAFGLFARHQLRQQARDLEQTVRQRTVELRGSERKYRNLFEDSRDAVLLVDSKRRIEDVNPATEELFGLSRVQLVDASVESLFDAPLGLASLLETRARTGFSSATMTRLGGSQHVLMSGNARRNASGEVVGYQVICRDRTRLVEMEEHLRQTQKMEAVGRMAGGIAHDFNNILTAILGYCDILSYQVAGNPKLEESLSVILDQARRAKALTGQIQVFSRAHVAEPRIVSLNEVVSGAEGLLRTLVGDGLQFSFDPSAGQVRIDPGKLEQIVVNLVVNARDAMPDGGVISIETRIEEPRDGAAREYVLCVSDTGRGMDEETRRKIFEPFFSTKPPGEGTGLGLAIVYGIVDQVGGTVQVESKLGHGTTFRIHFPACAEPPDAPELAPEPEELRKGSGNILVVEDEPSIRALLYTSLTSVGYDVEEAGDGKEALRKIAMRAEPYDLIVSDIVMPNMDGTDLLERVRRVYPETGFLFISGHPQFGSTEQARRGLQAPLLMKPFQPRTLIEHVRAILEDSPPNNGLIPAQRGYGTHASQVAGSESV